MYVCIEVEISCPVSPAFYRIFRPIVLLGEDDNTSFK